MDKIKNKVMNVLGENLFCNPGVTFLLTYQRK